MPGIRQIGDLRPGAAQELPAPDLAFLGGVLSGPEVGSRAERLLQQFGPPHDRDEGGLLRFEHVGDAPDLAVVEALDGALREVEDAAHAVRDDPPLERLGQYH